MGNEVVENFLIKHRVLKSADLKNVTISFSKRDLEISDVINIYKIRLSIATNNKLINFIEDLITNLENEKNDIKLRIIIIKGTVNVSIIPDSALSQIYGILYL